MTRRSKHTEAIIEAVSRRGRLTNTQLVDALNIDHRELGRLLCVLEQRNIVVRGEPVPSQLRAGPRLVQTWDLFVGPIRTKATAEKWSESETAYLRTYYPTNGAKEIGRALGKSIASVQSKAEREGLKCTKTRRSRAAKVGSDAAAEKADAGLAQSVSRLPAKDRCHLVARALASLPVLHAVWLGATCK